LKNGIFIPGSLSRQGINVGDDAGGADSQTQQHPVVVATPATQPDPMNPSPLPISLARISAVGAPTLRIITVPITFMFVAKLGQVAPEGGRCDSVAFQCPLEDRAPSG
jgi:hypothetical protein